MNHQTVEMQLTIIKYIKKDSNHQSPSPTRPEILKELYNQSLGHFQQTYNNQKEDWKSADTKAQSFVAAYVAILAIIYSALKDIDSPDILETFTTVSTLLFLAIALAILVLLNRRFHTPPDGTPFQDLIELNEDNEQLSRRIEIQYINVLREWESATKKNQHGLEDKYEKLGASTAIFFLFVCLITFLNIIFITSP